MRDWLAAGGGDGDADVVVLGAPISKASISPSQAWSTPAAFREALARYPTWDASTGADITGLAARDAGDVEGDRHDPDASAAHRRIEEAVAELAGAAAGGLVVVIGGDNSLTRPAFLGISRRRPQTEWGLLTLDAHHDCRPVTSASANGTPVRELIEGGLPGNRVAQVGIHPLGNAVEHARWALDQGVHVHDLDEVRRYGVEAVVEDALRELRRNGAQALYVDLDIDVVDRAFAPACPASLPGGLFPADLLGAARVLGRQPEVAIADLCEVDAEADVAGITVRLMAATFTALCAGMALREREAPPS
ncbi:MAG: arginase family protein [Candidatus Dormibacteraeota bacterium]|uniref:Arginase family protein n=1 Tax=Candidatus Aeolococcus gillhamiae TaxID=3127015 RepID=A0A934JRC7_9BACT|nr:arginase family protein [Candidatus Dormibacteraeota bacterium]